MRNEGYTAVHAINELSTRLAEIDDSFLEPELRHSHLRESSKALMKLVQAAEAAKTAARLAKLDRDRAVAECQKFLDRAKAGVRSKFGPDSREYEAVSSIRATRRRSRRKAKAKAPVGTAAATEALRVGVAVAPESVRPTPLNGSSTPASHS